VGQARRDSSRVERDVSAVREKGRPIEQPIRPGHLNLISHLTEANFRIVHPAMLLDTSALRPGDLLLSSTPGVVSKGIRVATASNFSHASIYYGSGVILEANDKGVGPTRIRPNALAPSGGIAGLPYDDWTTVIVLRHAGHSNSSSWQVAMRTALRESVGYDFPPMTVMAEGSRSLLGFLSRPIALVMDMVERLQNRAPIAWDAWCSRLVGYVLQEHFLHRLSERQRAALQYASPQRLYEIAKSLGYELVPDATCQLSRQATDAGYDAARAQYLHAQETVYQEWCGYVAQRRKALVAEETVRATRFNGKLLAVIALAAAGLLAVLAIQRSDLPAEGPDSKKSPVTTLTYAGNINITYPADNNRFLEFLESNVGKTVKISSMLDMSLSSDESFQIAELFGIENFENSPSTEIPLDGLNQQTCLKLNLLGDRKLPISFGGTGVVQFPLNGSFKVERTAQSGLRSVFHLTEMPVVVTEAVN
jgi:hypothetical protein